MSQPSLNFENPYVDVTAGKHRASPASVEANKRIAPSKRKDREEVLRIIKDQGSTHSKSIARIMRRPLNNISGRISELKAEGKIRETKERREGCAVLVLA